MPSRLDEIYNELRTGSTKADRGSTDYDFEFDLKGNFIFVGHKALKLVGSKKEQLEGLSVWDVICEEEHDLLLEKFAPDRKVAPKESYEFTIVTRDGIRKRIRVEIEPVFVKGKIRSIKGEFNPL
jgi:PAS domain S-box-containing protein